MFICSLSKAPSICFCCIYSAHEIWLAELREFVIDNCR